MIINCQEDKTEFLRLLETLYDAEDDGQSYITLRDLGNDHLFDRAWVRSIASAYPDLIRAEDYKPATGGRTSTRISLACDYGSAMKQAVRIQWVEESRGSNGNGHTAPAPPPEDDIGTDIWEHCILIAGLVCGVAPPEHVLAFALHYYRIVDRTAALSAIDCAAENLLKVGLCKIDRKYNFTLTEAGLAKAKRLISMPSADPRRRADEKYDAMLASMGRRNQTDTAKIYAALDASRGGVR